MHHVYAHQDKTLRFDQLSDREQANVLADNLAAEDLLSSVSTGRYITGDLPFEDVRLRVGTKIVSGSPTKAIYNHWGARVARSFLHDKGIVHRRDFNLVYWDGVEAAMTGFPDMFRSWITKHVSHFCGTNRQLSKIDTTVMNVCLSCGMPNESTSHITRCGDPGRTRMFQESVEELVSWLRLKRTNPALVDLVQRYLLARGSRSMQSLLDGEMRYSTIAKIHDSLGWDCFLEGRITILWLEYRKLDIAQHNLKSTAESWAKGFIHRLLSLTHRQWIYRNKEKHFKVEGLTLPQHEQLMEEVERHAEVDPEDLLPENRKLLDTDFAALGGGAAVDRAYWVAEMNAAVAAAAHVQRGSTQTLRSRYCSGPQYNTRSYSIAPMVETEGSLRWRRRRRRR